MRYNKNLIEEMKKDTEKKAAKVMVDEEKIKEQFQNEASEEFVEKYLHGKTVIQDIPISLLDDNPNNHFHRIEGEKWEEFVGSIKEYGILNPLIIRRKDEGRYEVLAGHNRKYAAIESGLEEAPCIITDVDDVDASVIVGVTNNQREETTDLEWGWAYRSTLETLKKAPHRPKKEESEKGTHDGHLLEVGTKTIDIVAQKYGVGKGTAQRKIRLTYLIEQLYNMLLESKVSQAVMIDLSYLSEVDQANLASEIAWNKVQITEEMAKELKAKAQELKGGDIGIDELYSFVSRAEDSQSEEKPKRPKKYSVEEMLFPKEVKKQEREEYITKALLYILEHNIKLYDTEPEPIPGQIEVDMDGELNER